MKRQRREPRLSPSRGHDGRTQAAKAPPAPVEASARSKDAADDRKEVQGLFASLRAALPALEELLAEAKSHWGYEDPIYRFYHQSWKVYGLQGTTLEIVDALQALAAGRPLNASFRAIIADGTGKIFAPEHNQSWLETTRPILEAFFHARYFLEMAVRYGKTLEAPPSLLPSGWAAFLYLYDLR